MKYRKRDIAILLIVVLAFGATGCQLPVELRYDNHGLGIYTSRAETVQDGKRALETDVVRLGSLI